jgi:Mn-dependent DtxR family transcriptional regulator
MDILKAIGKLHAGHVECKTRDMVAVLAGQKKTPEGFKKTLGKLKKSNLVTYGSGDTVDLTPKGLEVIGYAAPLDNATFHHEVIKELISSKAWEIFQKISNRETHEINTVAKEMGYDMKKLSGYQKDLSKLKTLGYIDKTKTTIKLTDKCFPCEN